MKATTSSKAQQHKLPVRQRLMDAAEQLFAEHGWTAVSVRDIVGAAGVNLAALNYYFGSKEQLLAEIFAVRAKPIAEERIRLLAEIEGQSPPAVEGVLEAFLRPALTLLPEQASFVKLRARLASEPEAITRKILADAFDESSRPFLTALARALPDLPEADLHWRFHFLLGTMVYTMANVGRIQALTEGRCDPGDGHLALENLVPFLAAGFRAAPVAHQARTTCNRPPKSPKPTSRQPRSASRTGANGGRTTRSAR